MTHLSEETLNEYLDGALSSSMRAEADGHLAACPVCHARLEALRGLFAELDALPEAALERDLSPVVMAAITARVPRVVRLAALVQALAAVAMLALAWPQLNLSALAPSTQLDLPSTLDLAEWFVLQWTVWMQALTRLNVSSAFSTSFSLNLDPPALLLTLTIVSACLLWLVGNGLLLRPRAGSYKRRNS